VHAGTQTPAVANNAGVSSYDLQERYNIAYTQCMYSLGDTVRNQPRVQPYYDYAGPGYPGYPWYGWGWPGFVGSGFFGFDRDRHFHHGFHEGFHEGFHGGFHEGFHGGFHGGGHGRG
jgi:hypothetical protein